MATSSGPAAFKVSLSSLGRGAGGMICGSNAPLQLEGDRKWCLENFGTGRTFQVREERRRYMKLVLDVPTGRDFSSAFTLPYIFFIQFAHAGAVVSLGDSQVA